MERRWLISAAAALALAAGPVLADEKVSEEEKTPPPAAPVAEAPAQPEASAAPEAEPEAQPAAPKAEKKEEPVRVAGAATGAPAPMPAEEKKPEPEPEPQPKFTYGGSADFYFSSNLNNPFNAKNQLRAWDIKDEHGPHLGLIDLWAQYARDPVGFRLDLNFGPTALLNHAFDYEPGNFWYHIQQAYISANLNKSGRTYIDVGKWNTTAGVEVTEARDNWLTSRGAVFFLAQPFYHVGGRVYHYLNDTDYVMAAVHRGWNATGNPHRAPGFAITGSKKLSDELTFTGSFYGGDEAPTAASGEAFRSFFDFVLLYNPENSPWAFTFNVDTAFQGGAKFGAVAAQAKYQFSPKSYAAARLEYILDDGFVGNDVFTATIGYGYHWNKYFQTRAEFRYDWASSDVFADNTRGFFTDSQPTFLISAILGYP